MLTYRLSRGTLVTAKSFDSPLHYANLTQANNAAAKIPGADVVRASTFGRGWYVRVPEVYAAQTGQAS
jgi:hypothetical protein